MFCWFIVSIIPINGFVMWSEDSIINIKADSTSITYIIYIICWYIIWPNQTSCEAQLDQCGFDTFLRHQQDAQCLIFWSVGFLLTAFHFSFYNGKHLLLKWVLIFWWRGSCFQGVPFQVFLFHCNRPNWAPVWYGAFDLPAAQEDWWQSTSHWHLIIKAYLAKNRKYRELI